METEQGKFKTWIESKIRTGTTIDIEYASPSLKLTNGCYRVVEKDSWFKSTDKQGLIKNDIDLAEFLNGILTNKHGVKLFTAWDSEEKLHVTCLKAGHEDLQIEFTYDLNSPEWRKLEPTKITYTTNNQ